MDVLIEQITTKMGIQDMPHVVGKVTELVRLLDLRSAQMPLNVNEYAKIVLCTDIATNHLGISIDKQQGIKLSGMRQIQYRKHKQMFEKLLDVKKPINIKDICLALDLNEVKEKAEELFKLYQEIEGSNSNYNHDLIHPQYAAMAVFQACKLTNRKVIKTKLMPYGNLRPTQWQNLEQRWENFVKKHHRNDLEKFKIQQKSAQKLNESENCELKRKIDTTSIDKSDKMEDYDHWKQRMLEMAELQLVKLIENEAKSKDNMLK